MSEHETAMMTPRFTLFGYCAWPLVLALGLAACEADDPDQTELGETEGDSSGWALAQDIEIDRVEINQGVAIPIVEQGQWIAGEQRNAPIVRSRPGLLRAYWTLAPDFEPRRIEARLILHYPDGSTRERSKILEVTGAADPARLSNSFTFELAAEDFEPGLEFTIDLWEVDRDGVETPTEQPAPATEPMPVGVQPEAAELKIVLVPIEFDYPGCKSKVDLDRVVPSLEQGMYAGNPVERLDLSIRPEPLRYTSAPSELGEVLTLILQLRSLDNAADNVYYHGLFTRCDNQEGWPGGLAFENSDTTPLATWMRASVGSYVMWNSEWSVRNFLHEVGHTQGLAHVACPDTDPTTPEPDYPYDEGLIGVWGYGLFDHALHDPAVAHDYMAYCTKGWWTADWTWMHNFRRITELTSWDTAAPPRGEPRTLLVGWIGDDGRRWWWTVNGQIARAADPSAARPRTSLAGVELDLPSSRHRVADGAADLVAIELPEVIPDSLEVDGVEVPVAAVLAQSELSVTR